MAKMEALLHFHPVKTPLYCEIPRNSHFSRSSLSFSAFPCRSFYVAMKNASKKRLLRVESVKKGIEAVFEGEEEEERVTEEHRSDAGELTCVMKFGGSSVASAERMREIAQLILRFPEENPVIVLSAMGKTTNNLLLVLQIYFSFGFYYCSFHYVIMRWMELMLMVMVIYIGWGERCLLRCFKCIRNPRVGFYERAAS